MEFIRDKSSLGWNILFPLLLVVGFAAVFSGEPKPLFKVGVVGDPAVLKPADATGPGTTSQGHQYKWIAGLRLVGL